MTPRLFGISMGWVPMAAGPVWMGLTVLMGIAAWTVFRADAPQSQLHGWMVVGFVVVCWAHPAYTAIADAAGVRRPVEFAGGLFTLALLVAVVVVVRRSSITAAGLLSPVAVWLGLASVYLWQVLRAEAA